MWMLEGFGTCGKGFRVYQIPRPFAFSIGTQSFIMSPKPLLKVLGLTFVELACALALYYIDKNHDIKGVKKLNEKSLC